MILATSNLVYLGVAAAIAAGLAWGSGDFIAAYLGEKHHPFQFTTSVYVPEIPILFLLMAATNQYGELKNNLIMMGAGTISCGAFFLLVYALSQGHISVGMSLTSITGLIIPAIVSVTTGENASILVWLGVVVSMIAIVCVTQVLDPEDHVDKDKHKKSLKIAIIFGILSGIGVGVFTSGLGAIESPIIAKLFWLQVPGLIVAIIYGIIKRGDMIVFSKTFWPLLLVGVIYNLGHICFAFASDNSSLIVANIIANLYPGVTILLARKFKHEKTSNIQHLGFAIAVLGLILVSVGAGN